MRIIYHAINGTGLGHLHRLTKLAVALRVANPAIHQVIVTNACDTSYPRSEGIPILSLPEARDQTLLGSGIRSRSIDAHVLNQTIISFAISYAADVIVFDTYVNEAFLVRLRESLLVNCRFVLVLRCGSLSFMRETLSIIHYFDLVLIAHSRRDFQRNWTKELREQFDRTASVRYVGMFGRPINDLSERTARIRFQHGFLENEKIACISFGSGGYSTGDASVLSDIIDTLCNFLKPKGILDRVVFVKGPNAQSIPKASKMTVLSAQNDLPALLNACSVAVCHGGYNTVVEALQVGVPTLVVPSPRRGENQANNLPSNLPSHIILEREPTPDRIQTIINRLLGSSQQPVLCSGADKAALELTTLVSSKLEIAEMNFHDFPILDINDQALLLDITKISNKLVFTNRIKRALVNKNQTLYLFYDLSVGCLESVLEVTRNFTVPGIEWLIIRLASSEDFTQALTDQYTHIIENRRPHVELLLPGELPTLLGH